MNNSQTQGRSSTFVLLLLASSLLLSSCGLARTGTLPPDRSDIPETETGPSAEMELERFEVGARIQEGIASWYGPDFQGKLTANGEIYDMDDLTAAHRTLPFNTVVRVTNLSNGRSVIVRINDRGPYVGDRVIDLSRRAAREIDMLDAGIGRVAIHLEQTGDRYVTRSHASNRESFTVQLASFDSREQAERESQNISGSEVVRVQVAGETYYRVYFGTYTRPEDAERELRQLRRRGHGGFVKQREN